MVIEKQTTIQVEFSDSEALAIIQELDNIIANLSDNTIYDLDQYKTLLALKSGLAMNL